MKLHRIALLSLLLVCALSLSLMAQVTWPGSFQRAYVCGNVTANGQPLGNVQVMAVGEGGMAMTRSNSNGNYSLGVGEGKWMIIATHEGYGMEKGVNVTLKGGEANEKTNIVMKKFNSFIKGKVVDEAGKPLPKSSVMAMNMSAMSGESDDDDSDDEDSDDDDDAMAGGMPSSVMTDNNGNFVLSVKKGTYLLSAYHVNYEMSPKNPPVKIPGMPEGMSLPNMQGVMVKIGENETKDGVVIILRPAKPISGRSDGDDDYTKPKAIEPMPLVLVGRACLPPQNVLHGTRTKNRNDFTGIVIKRSTVPFNSKEKGEVVELSYTTSPLGMLQEKGEDDDKKARIFSFTDTTAVSGKTYYYVVYEVGTKGRGPSSNVVELKTR